MRLAILAAVLPFAAVPAGAQHRLAPVFSSDLVINGVTTSADGRLFVPVQPASPGGGMEVAEIRDGKPVAYPDAHWNGWKPGSDGADRFVGVNAIRIGPDDFLWVVDRGSPGIGAPAAPHGVKLVSSGTSRASLVSVLAP